MPDDERSGEAASDDPPPTVYAVRVSVRAGRDVREAAAWIVETAAGGGGEAADIARGEAWQEGLLSRIGTLSTGPRRFAVDERASRLLGLPGTRRMVYRPTEGSAMAYHVFYMVEEEGDDGPQVRVIHIRHAARKPMTRAEGRQIREEQQDP